MKLVSVSPFRAVLKIDDSRDESYSEDHEGDLARDTRTRQNNSETRRRESPIKHASEHLREQRDSFLRSFSGQRMYDSGEVLIQQNAGTSSTLNSQRSLKTK
jgi:hypothetical protein